MNNDIKYKNLFEIFQNYKSQYFIELNTTILLNTIIISIFFYINSVKHMISIFSHILREFFFIFVLLTEVKQKKSML